MTRLAYSVHKWLAVVLGLATLGWFISGAMMSLPGGTLTLTKVPVGPDAEARLPGAPEFDAARLLPADAIAAVRARYRSPVETTGVELRRLPGRLVYQVDIRIRGPHLVDAISGEIVSVDEDMARQIVTRFFGPDVRIGTVEVQRNPTPAFLGPVPAFKLSIDDANGTIVYVDVRDGRAQRSDRLSRPSGVIQRLHGLGFLRVIVPRGHWVLVAGLSLLGAVMTIAGLVILYVQFKRWWQRSRLRAA